MSAHGAGQALRSPPGAGGWRARLRERLGPRSEERRGRGEMRLIETFLLVVVGVVLLVATSHDLYREVGIGDRLAADLKSWERYVRAVYDEPGKEPIKYHNPSVQQDIKTYTTRDVVCANLWKGKPEGRVMACLIFTGPYHGLYRRAQGGYYVIAAGTDEHQPLLNEPKYSYGCFGSAVHEGLCARAPVPGKPDKPLLGGA